MRLAGVAALLAWSGAAILTGTLVLDTWRPGQFFLLAGLILGTALVFAGLGVLLWASLRSGADGARWSARLAALASLGVLAGIFGFGVLKSRGYAPAPAQFVQARVQQPFGPAQFSRGPDGALHITMVHGSGVAIERTLFPLDATPNAEQLEAAHALVDRTRLAAARFSDFEVARTQLGFTIAAAELEGDDSPSIEHLVNPDNMRDSRLLDPDHPESLVYQFLPTGEKRLVAVMYMTRPGQHGPQFGGSLTRWHWHPEAPACMDEFGILAARKENGRCPAGLSSGPTSEMLHVWLVDHSLGVFAHLMGTGGDGAAGSHAGHE